MTETEEIKRAEDAKYILEHPLFVEALGEIRKGLINGLETSAMGDEKTHNHLAIALQLLKQIETNLKSHIQTGEMALIQVNERMGAKLKRVVGL